MTKIRVAIVGVGNCASSLIQGIFYYKDFPDNSKIIWLINNDIGNYKIGDIDIVCAIDVNNKKIWKTLAEAIFEDPNCTSVFQKEITSETIVMAWPILDGISDRMMQIVPTHEIVKGIQDWEDIIVEELLDKKVDILVSYLPVGSVEASKFYANCALRAKVWFANAIPEFICSSTEWSEKFSAAWVPCAGDDIKSQFWATIVHRMLVDLINQRGLVIDNTYQLNIGWNTDFENMKDEFRLSSKRVSKTEAVTSMITDYQLETKIWPSDHIPHLLDNKVCYINIKGKQFGNVPFEMDLKLSVEDSPNSAGVMVDVIRLLKVAKDNNLSWYQNFSAYYFKHPHIQFRDNEAQKITQDFIKKYASKTQD